MKAVHIISHNAILSRDEKGRRCIVAGKGIGFMKERGDRINQELIRNVFIEKQDYTDRRTIYN